MDVDKSSETIVACATGVVRAGISIVRVSGPAAANVCQSLTQKPVPTPNKAVYRKLYGHDGDAVDQCVCIYFRGPRSFTGEDLVEFHTHGSPYIVEQVIAACLASGAVYARPGQFSERAFLNGKMDLAQAESIADLIDSQSKAQAVAALSSLNGAFSGKVRLLQNSLIAIRTQLEASIDFSEQDIDSSSWDSLIKAQKRLNEDGKALIEKVKRAIHTTSGLRVVIVGRPNAGKSSLLNELTQKDSAIVTDVPGTTRDILKASITHKGSVLEIIDTAGLRQSDDPVEAIGVKKAYEAIDRADVIWLLADANQVIREKKSEFFALVPEHRHKNIMWVANKVDLLENAAGLDKKHVDCAISAKAGKNITALLDKTVKRQGDWVQSDFSARERHLRALEEFQTHLVNALSCPQGQLDLAAEDLRYAQEHLSVITGEYHSEDLLSSIFGTFCLGK